MSVARKRMENSLKLEDHSHANERPALACEMRVVQSDDFCEGECENENEKREITAILTEDIDEEK